jgi:hypothetical protein
MSINSLWFWGGASLPVYPAQTMAIEVYADESFVIALCEQYQIKCRPLSQLSSDDYVSLFAAQEPRHVVIVDTRLISALSEADENRFDQLTQAIHRQYLAPLAKMVKQGQLGELQLLTEDGLHGHVTASRKWWQRLIGRRS